MEIKSQVPLQDFSFYRIGGPAKYFCEPQNETEIVEALTFAVERRLRVYVLGGGTNVLISDRGFDGLVIKMKSFTWEAEEMKTGVRLTAGGGTALSAVVMQTAEKGWAGMEWAAGLPATLGGAAANNAGAHGGEMSQVVESVAVFEFHCNPSTRHLESFRRRVMPVAECIYAYRTSIFKTQKNFLIFAVTLHLQPSDRDELKAKISEILKMRAAGQPLNLPSLGSTFKNPSVSEKEAIRFFEKLPEAREVCHGGTLPAGFLIEAAGLKDKRVGGVQVSAKHANFLVNTGGATAEDVVILISIIKQKVRDEFGIQLAEEIEYVGF